MRILGFLFPSSTVFLNTGNKRIGIKNVLNTFTCDVVSNPSTVSTYSLTYTPAFWTSTWSGRLVSSISFTNDRTDAKEDKSNDMGRILSRGYPVSVEILSAAVEAFCEVRHVMIKLRGLVFAKWRAVSYPSPRNELDQV